MYYKKLQFLVLITILQYGCGGGSGSNDNPQPVEENDNDDTPTETYTDLNGDVKGLIFIADRGKYLNLATGKFTEIDDDDSNHFNTPSPDGTEYVERIKGYRRDHRCWPSIETVKITIKDVRTNLTRESFEITENVWGPVKLSPDGQYLALIWQNIEDCPDDEDDVDDLLTIFDRNGNLISQSTVEVGTFDWLPDNRLIYANSYEIYVSHQPHRAAGEMVASLAEIPGFPTRLSASRDGRRVVFEMATDVPHWLMTVSYRDATVWMMNTDGTDLRRFATASREDDPEDDYDDPRINNPLWTLDSNKVIAMEGFFSGIAPVQDTFDLNPGGETFVHTGIYGLTYILPVTDQEYRLPPEESVGILAELYDDDTPVIFRESCDSHLFLVPAVEPLPEVPGSNPPRNSQALNGGMTGTLYYVDYSDYDYSETVILSLDLATGQVQEFVTLSTVEYHSFSISHDAQYIAHFDDDSDDEKFLKIKNSNGETVKSISLYTSYDDYEIYGSPSFSPVNSDLLVFDYKDDNDNHYVAVINWITGEIIKFFKDQEYYNPFWTSDGNVMLIGYGENGVYLASVDNNQIGEPIKQFTLPDGSLSHVASPDGSKIAFEMSHHVWTINMDGTELKPVTAPNKGYEGYPVWSTDGRYLIIKRARHGSGIGAIYALSGDAENIHLNYDNPNLIPIKNNQDGTLYSVRGYMALRP